MLFALATGCGGRAIPGSDEDDGEPSAPESVGGRGTTPQRMSPGSAGRPAPLDFPETMLPDCQPGFQSRGPGDRRCRYTFEGLCYEDEQSVCACACPRAGSEATCVFAGGLIGEDDRPIGVVCQALP
jgi:hypothetical protein